MSSFLKNAAAAVNGAAATEPASRTPEAVNFPLNRIAPDTVAQTRVMLNATKVTEYAKDMQDPDLLAEFPPIHLFEDQDGTIRVSRGYTRVAAARQAGLLTFRALLFRGTARDAKVHALGDNATHGEKRSNADLLHELDMVLTDPELAQWSDREIARRVKCSHRTVGERRRYWAERGQEQSSERLRTDRYGNTTAINVGGIAAANAARASRTLDEHGTYSVIQRALTQQDAGVQARYNWLMQHDAPEAFAAFVPVGFKLDDHTFANQWQRVHDALTKQLPKDGPAKGETQPQTQPAVQPRPQPAPTPGNGDPRKFVPAIAPVLTNVQPVGVEHTKQGRDALGNLSVYLDGVLEELSKVGSLLDFDSLYYANQTKALKALVEDVLEAMEAHHREQHGQD